MWHGQKARPNALSTTVIGLADMARTIAKDHDTKRQVILDRAAQLFADEGFDRTSVSRVAQACAISKANIYHYYSSKDDILFDILDSYLSGLRDRICGLSSEGLSPEARFQQMIAEVLLAYQGADNEHRLQVGSLGFLPEARQEILRTYQRDLVRHASGLIADIAPKIFREDKAKLRATTMSVFGMLNWFYMWNRNADARARMEYADLVCGLCLRGIPRL